MSLDVANQRPWEGSVLTPVRPVAANEAAFERAVGEVAGVAARLLPRPRNREDEAARARARHAKRFGER